MSFLLDIISNIEDSENNPKMAEVLLNIPTEDREYIILGDGIDITVSSSNRSVELPKCQIYTVKVKNGKCSDSTSSSFLVPKGRCTRVLVVSFLIFFRIYFYMQ